MSPLCSSTKENLLPHFVPSNQVLKIEKNEVTSDTQTDSVMESPPPTLSITTSNSNSNSSNNSGSSSSTSNHSLRPSRLGPKKQVAILMGYCGHGYQGMQMYTTS
ncbi:hypothetical protein HMI54_013504 [Coelomomyces lativittatus]|nr:hypothetical protein HMI54_013504 [Coelomomyces lativittatus]